MKERTGAEMIEELKRTRPDVAITVTRKPDLDSVWDGDGPDPRDDGYLPFAVTVTAATIRNGTLHTGTDSLYSCYFREDEATGEVNGYLPQMIDAALAELDQTLAAL